MSKIALPNLGAAPTRRQTKDNLRYYEIFHSYPFLITVVTFLQLKFFILFSRAYGKSEVW